MIKVLHISLIITLMCLVGITITAINVHADTPVAYWFFNGSLEGWTDNTQAGEPFVYTTAHYYTSPGAMQLSANTNYNTVTHFANSPTINNTAGLNIRNVSFKIRSYGAFTKCYLMFRDIANGSAHDTVVISQFDASDDWPAQRNGDLKIATGGTMTVWPYNSLQILIAYGGQYKNQGYADGIVDDVIVYATAPTSKNYVIATCIDGNTNGIIPNMLVSLEYSNHNVAQNLTSDVNGSVCFDLTGSVNATYYLHTYSTSYYDGSTQIIKPDNFVTSGNNFNCTVSLTRFPITKFGSIFSIDSVTRYNIFPTNFKVVEYENGYTQYMYSGTGSLYCNYTFLHHYNVTASVANYLNTTVQVIPQTDNFRGYIEMDYGANLYYDITGQVFSNDVSPIPLINAVVCWYYSNGTLMAGTYTDGAGYYHLKSPVNISADNYNVISSSSGYTNTTYRLAVPTNFINSGTLHGVTYYLTNCNIYMALALAANTSYANFYVDDLFQSPIQFASIVITSTSDNTKVYSYTTDKYGQLKTPNLPIDNYVFQVTATNFQKSAGSYYNSVANAGQQILVKLAPVGWQNPTQTPTINPSGNPSYIITPTPNPSGNPSGNPSATANPFTGNSTGSGWGDLANSYLSNFGVTDKVTQGIIIGLIITLFCGFCGASFSSYVANGSSSIVIYSTIFFGAIGFICSCLIGFIPIWVLMVFILILIGALAFIKFGGDK